jgi:uncharacterized protein (DUF4415 family)
VAVLGVATLKTGADQGAVSLRLSPGVVKNFKDKGPGWQRPIDNALRSVTGVDKALDKAAGTGWSQ